MGVGAALVLGVASLISVTSLVTSCWYCVGEVSVLGVGVVFVLVIDLVLVLCAVDKVQM